MQFSRFILIAAPVGLLALLSEFVSIPSRPQNTNVSFYDFKVAGLEGGEINFDSFKGKKVLVVNTASHCGFTPQFKDLQKLHETMGDRLVIIGFPSNDFFWQERGSNSEIANFCERNYGVSFLMAAKISVKGRDQHPLYEWLQKKTGKAPSWNFCKYIISEQGEVLGFFPSRVNPLDAEITSLLQ